MTSVLPVLPACPPTCPSLPALPAALKRQLVELQSEVAAAHQRLHLTQARVEHNLQRIGELKGESERLGHLAQAAAAVETTPAAAPVASPLQPLARPAAVTPAAAAAPPPARRQPQPREHPEDATTLRRRRGLHSSLEAEEVLKNHWFAVAFASKLTEVRLGRRRRRRLVAGLTLCPLAAAINVLPRFHPPSAHAPMPAALLPCPVAPARPSQDMLIPFELFGQAWVLFRGDDGAVACVRDECAHRACPLSAGRVVDGQIECPYHGACSPAGFVLLAATAFHTVIAHSSPSPSPAHPAAPPGWRYNGAGDCTKMPSTQLCRGIAVASLPCAAADGFVWVWPGWEAPGTLPACTPPPPGYKLHAEIEVEVPVEHGLLVENLLDLAHAPFTHTSTFARGWPVPDAVKFHASRLLGGNWDPCEPAGGCWRRRCCVGGRAGLWAYAVCQCWLCLMAAQNSEARLTNDCLIARA